MHAFTVRANCIVKGKAPGLAPKATEQERCVARWARGRQTCLWDRDPAWCRLSKAYKGRCDGQVSETGDHGKTKAGTQDSVAVKLPSQQ